MRVGVPKEIKNHKYGVGMTPWGCLNRIARRSMLCTDIRSV
jgi:alanine dehydrogenase